MPTEQEAAALAVLKRVAIFSSLSEPEFAFLTAHLVSRKYGTGEMIFGEGDPCSGLYVVQSGNVRIFKSSAGGREQVLSIDGPGGSIAELPVFDGGNYPASAQAVSDTHAAVLQPPGFPVALPAASPGRAESVARDWRTPATAGQHHRGAVVHHRAPSPDRAAGSTGQSRRGAERRRCHARRCRPTTPNWQHRSARCANWCRAT